MATVEFAKLEGALREGWTVTRNVDSAVTLEKEIYSPVVTLTAIEIGDEEE